MTSKAPDNNFCLEIFTDANVYRQMICFHVSNDGIMVSKQYLHYRPSVRRIDHQRSIPFPLKWASILSLNRMLNKLLCGW